jgi:hypothetical protein
MGFQFPLFMTGDEESAVTAFIHYMYENRNRIVSEKAKPNEKELSRLKMSDRDGFVPDPRPDTPAGKAQQPRQLHALR